MKTEIGEEKAKEKPRTQIKNLDQKSRQKIHNSEDVENSSVELESHAG